MITIAEQVEDDTDAPFMVMPVRNGAHSGTTNPGPECPRERSMVRCTRPNIEWLEGPPTVAPLARC